jgi:hypothetical protein
VAWRQTRARLNETQKRIDAAEEDLGAIVQAELGYIEKQGKFPTLDELVSSRSLGPEMAGRHGYVYSIRLEGNAITAQSASNTIRAPLMRRLFSSWVAMADWMNRRDRPVAATISPGRQAIRVMLFAAIVCFDSCSSHLVQPRISAHATQPSARTHGRVMV